jgi:ubiquinone/menaquinone biosynthesis C-methylase UbiE
LEINKETQSIRKKMIDSYNQIFDESNRLLEMPSFYSWVLDQLNPESNKKLLDIATGLGTLPKIAKDRNLCTVGVDISKQAVKQAINFVNCPFFVCDGEKLPFSSESFDYITNLGSLEHFVNPSEGIQEIYRVLKINGKAAIYLPNSYYLVDIIRNVLLKGYGPSHNQPIERFATVNEWADLIKLCGLSIKKMLNYNILFPRSRDDWSYIRMRPKRLIASLLSPFIPFNLSYSFLYICEKS